MLRISRQGQNVENLEIGENLENLEIGAKC